MGQHKYNPTAKLSKAGKLPPKAPKKRMTKREYHNLVIGGLSMLYPSIFLSSRMYR